MAEFQSFETEPIIVGPLRKRDLKNPVSQTALRNQEKIVTADSRTMERKATAEDIEYAVAFMEQSFSIQSERLQIIVDAALLAAEQVQDKRIEAQEKGKRVTIEDVIFDLLTVYLWEVGIIGHVLSPLVMHTTEVIWKKSLSMEAVYNRLEKSDYGSELIGYARREEKDSARRGVVRQRGLRPVQQSDARDDQQGACECGYEGVRGNQEVARAEG